jgi:hypothetical protein
MDAKTVSSQKAVVGVVEHDVHAFRTAANNPVIFSG